MGLNIVERLYNLTQHFSDVDLDVYDGESVIVYCPNQGTANRVSMILSETGYQIQIKRGMKSNTTYIRVLV